MREMNGLLPPIDTVGGVKCFRPRAYPPKSTYTFVLTHTSSRDSHYQCGSSVANLNIIVLRLQALKWFNVFSSAFEDAKNGGQG